MDVSQGRVNSVQLLLLGQPVRVHVGLVGQERRRVSLTVEVVELLGAWREEVVVGQELSGMLACRRFPNLMLIPLLVL